MITQITQLGDHSDHSDDSAGGITQMLKLLSWGDHSDAKAFGYLDTEHLEPEYLALGYLDGSLSWGDHSDHTEVKAFSLFGCARNLDSFVVWF